MIKKIKTFWSFYKNYKNQDYRELLHHYKGLKYHCELQEKNWEQEKQEWEQEKQMEELEHASRISNMQQNFFKYYKNLATKQCSEEISGLKLELMEKIALYTEKLNKLEEIKKKL